MDRGRDNRGDHRGIQPASPSPGVAPDLSLDQLVTQVKLALARRTRWLLIFDNAEEPALLEPFLPRCWPGGALITSRNPAWHGLATPLEVTAFTLAEASESLQQRTGHHDPAAAKDLAEQLGRLPLALEQAAAYIDGHQPLTLTGYRRRAFCLVHGPATRLAVPGSLWAPLRRWPAAEFQTVASWTRT